MERTANISYDNIDNRFLFVLVAAKRALQVQKGAKPRVELSTKKPTVVAMVEVMEHKVGPEVPEKPKRRKASK